jgi:hypothetical protein
MFSIPLPAVFAARPVGAVAGSAITKVSVSLAINQSPALAAVAVIAQLPPLV